MKKVKVLLPLIAMILAIGTSAFRASESRVKTVDEQKWYDFTGDDPNDPADYQLHTGLPPTCNSGSDRCAVRAVQNTSLPGDQPDLNDPSIQIRNKP